MGTAVFKKYLTILFFSLLILSCSDSNENINQPPSIFQVSVDLVSDITASISWSESVDPEGSTVFYDVYINSVKIADNVTEKSYTFENLIEGVNYSGKIIASDPEGNTVSSLFEFNTSVNQSPSQFNVVVTNTSPFYSRIEWTESIDPEGEAVTYNVYLGNEVLVEGITTLNNVFPELKGLFYYSGRIEAVDVSGKTTTIEYSFTTEVKIYNGNLFLDNQPLVESFGNAGYNEINGDLSIGSLQSNLTNVENLSTLETLNSVNGNVSIRNTICTNFNGLNNIVINYPYAKLTIEKNNQLLNFSGLNNISTVHEVYIAENNALLSLEGLTSLTSVTNYIEVVFNPSLNSLLGLQNLTHVSNALSIINNDSLISLTGLEGISNTRELNIVDNNGLETLEGLNNYNSCSDFINISNNNTLQNLSGLSNLNSTVTLYIADNPLLQNLRGLENLTNVNHTLEISRNSGLLTLNGIENVIFSNNQANYHVLTIWENVKITNLDPLSNYAFDKGKINIYFNSQLSDLCGITTLVTEINTFINSYNFTSNNAYNPSEIDILNGNCSI